MEIQVHPETGERIISRRWIIKQGRETSGQKELTVHVYTDEGSAYAVADALNKHRCHEQANWLGEYWVKESYIRVVD